MQTTFEASMGANAMTSNSNAVVWTGRVLSTLAVLFLIFDGAMKVIR